jgi:taurine dioxygenase
VESQAQSWLTSKLQSKNGTGPRPEIKSLPERYEPGRTPIEAHNDYQFDELRPRFPEVAWEALGDVPYEDKGLSGDPRFRNLLEAADDIFDYGPKVGTEISGIKLNQLNDAQKCDLARLIATRGVVFVRDQEHFDIEAQRELGQFFGTLHKHATTGVPEKEGLEDVHVIYTTDKSRDQRALFSPTFLWHSDVR